MVSDKEDVAYSVVLKLTALSVTLSFLSLSCGILLITFESHFYYIGHAIWGAMFYFMSSYSAIIAVKWKTLYTDVLHKRFSLANWAIGISIVCILLTEISEDKVFNYWTDPSFCDTSCNDEDNSDDPENEPFPNCTYYTFSCHENFNAVMTEVVALITTIFNFAVNTITGFMVSTTLCGKPTNIGKTIAPKDKHKKYLAETYKNPSRFFNVLKASSAAAQTTRV